MKWYIEPEEATKVRVFPESDHWAIDAADDSGEYTANCWTHYDDQLLTKEKAIEVAPLFAIEIGKAGLPIQVCDD